MRTILVAFDGAQGLDVLGPAEVLAAAQTDGSRDEVILASVGGGDVRLTCGVVARTVDLLALRPGPRDTVLVVGGPSEPVRRALACEPLIRWIARAARVARRVASVCSGAFLLAHAGVLDGKRAATHWAACELLARFRPSIDVDANAIFVQEGRVWTSAGVTTGIDMALAMVEEDRGRREADRIAAHLVLYARRPGFQSQFSEALIAQRAASDPLGDVLVWARDHLAAPLDAPALAKRAGMSLRSFHRRCAEELGTSPAKLVEGLRVEHARALLTTTKLGTKTIAARSGFGTANRMVRAFRRALGVSPSEYALLHAR